MTDKYIIAFEVEAGDDNDAWLYNAELEEYLHYNGTKPINLGVWRKTDEFKIIGEAATADWEEDPKCLE